MKTRFVIAFSLAVTFSIASWSILAQTTCSNERDALFRVVAEGRDGKTTRLADVMTRNPQTVKPDQPFSVALQMMYGGKFRNVPVVEDGRPVGIISARDALGPELEAFVYELLRQEQVENILA